MLGIRLPQTWQQFSQSLNVRTLGKHGFCRPKCSLLRFNIYILFIYLQNTASGICLNSIWTVLFKFILFYWKSQHWSGSWLSPPSLNSRSHSALWVLVCCAPLALYCLGLWASPLIWSDISSHKFPSQIQPAAWSPSNFTFIGQFWGSLVCGFLPCTQDWTFGREYQCSQRKQCFLSFTCLCQWKKSRTLLQNQKKKKMIETLVENIRMFFSVYGLIICKPHYTSLLGWFLKDTRK